jgi:alkanesulfonate monooxygenase SsuD/methylene tetrahydromethanopterin reductase-like flavin-dependent oxidoreductase (luciferase family)
MAYFGLRFDLRNPSFAGVGGVERYREALDMAAWADRLGFVTCVLSEHHGSDDGYCPSPITMAAAVAARTQSMRIQLAAIVASFHDPLRLAEDLAVADLISGGRLDVVVTNGYVAGEFAMFDRPLSERPARTTETVEVLRAAWSGEPFDYRGRTVCVTPAPAQPGGPSLTLGGSTPAAARRAARLGLKFMPSSPEVWQPYRDAVIELGGDDPGPHLGGDTSFFHLAADVEAGWEAIAPHALHEVNAYGAWQAEAGVEGVGGYSRVTDADALRATGQYRVMTPGELVAELRAAGPYAFAMFHPMMGGIPPELAWSSLHLFEREVLPQL